MSTPFDPANLTPAASLNRVRVVAPPGAPPDPDLRDRTAYDLLSGRAFAGQIARRAAALDLLHLVGHPPDPTDLLPASDRRLADRRPEVRAAADDVARQFGRRLGYLLLALHRGDDAARTEWDKGYRAHRTTIRAVYLAGGIVAGRLGPRLVRHAASVLAKTGADLAVRLAPHPRLLPLIGAARTVPAGAPAAVVVDVGQSAVKRAVAAFGPMGLAEIRPLPTVPAPRGAEEGAVDDVARLAEEVAAIVAGSWRDAHRRRDDPAPLLVVAVACYLRDGQPLPRPGAGYAALRGVSPNLARWLAGRVSAAVGDQIAITLVHDGTAAARALAGADRAAVVTLGTALGVGFPPTAAGLRPLAAGFAVRPGGAATVQRPNGRG